MRLRALILASFCTLALAASAMAQTTYVCVLSGLSESPPNASPATGNATCVLDAAGTTLTCTVQFQNLTSGWTASHIHGPAPAGVNAAVKWGLLTGWVFGPGNQSGTLTNFVIAGITPADKVDLDAGRFYVNIHTSQNPGGELRGQMASSVVPTLKTTWNRVKALYR